MILAVWLAGPCIAFVRLFPNIIDKIKGSMNRRWFETLNSSYNLASEKKRDSLLGFFLRVNGLYFLI